MDFKVLSLSELYIPLFLRTAMNVLGDSIGCAVVQANVELEPVKKIEEAVEIDDATEASSSL